MTDLSELFSALKLADAAGNTDDARKIADIIRRESAASSFKQTEKDAEPAVAPTAPVEQPKERTFGEAATDLAAGLKSGIGSVIQLPGQLYGLATGDFEDSGILGFGKRIAKSGEDMKSEALKQKEKQRSQKIQDAEDKGQWEAFKTAFGETVKDPALFASFLAEQAPQMLVPFGGAKVIKGLTLAKGLRAGLPAIEATQAAGAAGTRAAIGAGAVQQGSDIGAGAYEELYKALVLKGTPEEEAKSQALNLARAAGASGAVISLLAQRLPGAKTLEESFAGVPGTSGRLLGAAKGALGETASEIVEETGGKFAQNVAMRQVNPEQQLAQGLGATAGMAAIGGGTLGGVAGALRTPQADQAAQPPPPPPEAPQIDPDKYGAVIKGLTAAIPDSGLTDSSKLGEIFKASGIENEAEVSAYLNQAITSGEIVANSNPVFNVTDANGKVLFNTVEKAVADKAAERLNAEDAGTATVAEATATKFTKPTGMPQGIEVRAGQFKQDMFNISRGDTILNPEPLSAEEVGQKAYRLSKITAGSTEANTKEIEVLQKKIDTNNTSKEKLEAAGEALSPEYATLSAQVNENNALIQAQIDEVKQKGSAFSGDISITPAKESEEGFTLFKQGKPAEYFKTEEDLNQALAAEPTAGTTSPKPEALDAAREALREKLLPFLKQVGLENAGLRIMDSIENGQGSSDGVYAEKIISISLQAANPMGTLRHETIHALKELGAFTKQEWSLLESYAKKQWVNQFLRQRKIGDSNYYDTYKKIYLETHPSIAGFDEYIIEEAIADAFKYFNATKPPANIIGNIYRKVKAFLEGMGNQLSGLGFQTADDVFKRVEAGQMKPTQQAGTGAAPRYSYVYKGPKDIPQNIWNLHQAARLAEDIASGRKYHPSQIGGGRPIDPGQLKRNQTMSFRRFFNAVKAYLPNDEEAQLKLMRDLNVESGRREEEAGTGAAPRYSVTSLESKRKDIFTDPDTLEAWRAIGRNGLAQPVAERFSTKSKDEAEREVYKKYLTKKDILEAARIQGNVKPNQTTEEGSVGNQYIQNLLYERSNDRWLDEIKELKKSGKTELERAQEEFGETVEDKRTDAQKSRDAMSYNRERVEFLKKTPEELEQMASDYAGSAAYSDQAESYQEAQAEGVTLSDADLEKIGDTSYKNAYGKELTRLQKRQEKLLSERAAPRYAIRSKPTKVMSMEDLGKVIPASERVASKNPSRLLNGKKFSKADLNNIGEGFLVYKQYGDSDAKGFVTKIWNESINDVENFVSGSRDGTFIQDLVESLGAKPPTAKFLNDSLSLSDSARYWYETSAEALDQTTLNTKNKDLLINLISATSQNVPPLPNMRRGISVMSEYIQNKPIETDLISKKPVADAISNRNIQTLKFGNFADTMKFINGYTPNPPVSTNDRQVAAIFNMEPDEFAKNPVLYAVVSKFYAKIRDSQNEMQGEGKQPYESWQIQALNWVEERGDNTSYGTKTADSYDQAIEVITEQLKNAGIPLEKGKIGMSTLKDPRVPNLLSGTMDVFQDAVKATIESNTLLNKSGSEANQEYDKIKGINEPWARNLRKEFLMIQTRVLKQLSSSKAIEQVAKLATGENVKAFSMSRMDADARGTFEGNLSPNIRVPMFYRKGPAKKLISDDEVNFILSVLGSGLDQAAMAGSLFKLDAQGETYRVFLPDRKITDVEATTFEKKVGFPLNLYDVPNGAVVEINIGGYDTRPTDASVRAALDATFGKKVNAKIAKASYKSTYLTKEKVPYASSYREIIYDHRIRKFGRGNQNGFRRPFDDRLTKIAKQLIAIANKRDGQFEEFTKDSRGRRTAYEQKVAKKTATTKGGKHSLQDTVYIDGVNRPTTDSRGRPIFNTLEGIKNFWRGFGDSAIVDKDGKPMLMYHGTTPPEDSEDIFSQFRSSDDGKMGKGIYTTSIEKYAESFAPSGAVMPIYISMSNPFYINLSSKVIEGKSARTLLREQISGESKDTFDKNYFRLDSAGSKEINNALNNEIQSITDGKRLMDMSGISIQRALKKAGYDGIVVKDSEGNFVEVNAFDSEQIKSATGNRGTFSPKSKDIRYSLREFKVNDLPQTKQTYTIPANTLLFHGAHKKQADKIESAGKILLSKPPVKTSGGTTEEGGLIFFSEKQIAEDWANNLGDPFSVIFDEKAGNKRENGVVFQTGTDKPYKLINKDYKLSKLEAAALTESLGLPDYKRVSAGDTASLAAFRASVFNNSKAPRYIVKNAGQEQEMSAPWPIIFDTLRVDGFFDNFAVALSADNGIRLVGKEGRMEKFSLSDTPAFKRWFGDSKAVVKDGSPMVLYRGMDSDYGSTMRVSKDGALGAGIYMTPDPKFAQEYVGQNGNIAPLFASLQNPLVIQHKSNEDPMVVALVKLGMTEQKARSLVEKAYEEKGYVGKQVMNRALAQGFDGLMQYRNGNLSEVVAFSKTQVKSAIGNRGTFDPYNPDIRYSLRDDFITKFGQADLTNLNSKTHVREEVGYAKRLVAAFSPDSRVKLRAQIVNRLEAIERQTMKVSVDPRYGGSNELLADVSATAAALQSQRASGIAAESFKRGVPVYANGFTSVSDLNGTVDGLIPIFQPLLNKYKDPMVWQLFQFYSATRRGGRFIQEGREKLFTAADIQKGKDYGIAYPEFDSVFKEYQKYNEGLVKFQVDTGVLTPELGRKWMMYSDYIPFYRQINGEETLGPKLFQNFSGVKPTPIAKGSDVKIADFLETIILNSRSAIENGMKNVASQRIARDAMRTNSPNMQDMARKLAHWEKDAADVIHVRENGVDVRYKVADILLVEAMKGLGTTEMGSMLKFLSYPTKVLRDLVTKDPGFMLANLFRDSAQAYVTSGVNMIPIIDTFKQAAKILANQSPEAKALMAAGIGGGYEFSGDVKASAKAVSAALNEKAGIKTGWQKALWPVSKVWSALEAGTTASDLATRSEIYARVMKSTNGNEAEAVYQALEVMNFGRMGSSPVIQVVSALVPFFNARVQGLDVLYRAGTGRLASASAKTQQKLFARRAMYIMGMSIAYWMLARDTDEWKRASKETRDNNWIIGSVKVPIPFEIGTIFKVLPERILEYTFGNDTGADLADSAFRNIASTLKMVPVPQAVLPLVEAYWLDYSFFTGNGVVGRGMEKLDPQFQLREGTSLVAKKMGDITGMSPVKIDHVLQGYTGAMGMYAASAISAMIRTEDDGAKASMSLEQTPILKRFFASDKAGGSIDAFYEFKKQVDMVVATQDELQKRGNPEQYIEYMKTNGKLLGAKQIVSNIGDKLSEMRKLRNIVNFSKSMPPDQKRETLDNIRMAEIKLTESIKGIRAMVTQ